MPPGEGPEIGEAIAKWQLILRPWAAEINFAVMLITWISAVVFCALTAFVVCGAIIVLSFVVRSGVRIFLQGWRAAMLAIVIDAIITAASFVLIGVPLMVLGGAVLLRSWPLAGHVGGRVLTQAPDFIAALLAYLRTSWFGPVLRVLD